MIERLYYLWSDFVVQTPWEKASSAFRWYGPNVVYNPNAAHCENYIFPPVPEFCQGFVGLSGARYTLETVLVIITFSGKKDSNRNWFLAIEVVEFAKEIALLSIPVWSSQTTLWQPRNLGGRRRCRRCLWESLDDQTGRRISHFKPNQSHT